MAAEFFKFSVAAVIAGLLLSVWLSGFPPQADLAFSPPIDVGLQDVAGAVKRYAGLMKHKTISNRTQPNHVSDAKEFAQLHKYLRATWPRVFSKLQVETVAEYSLLLTWRGSDAALAPVLYISHLDVVPIAPGTEQEWTHPPFSGVIADGFVWGRGAIDLRLTLGAILESLQQLIDTGFEPCRTLLVAIGHDEEVGGTLGAGADAAALSQRGIARLEATFDEGYGVMEEGVVPPPPNFAQADVAIVATAEKGYASFEVEIRGRAGHSSMPPPPEKQPAAALGALLHAAASSPLPLRVTPPAAGFLKSISTLALAPAVRAGYALVDAPVVAPLVAWVITRVNARSNWMLRSTCSVTRAVSESAGDNVLPQTAVARFNCRLLPGDTADDAEAYLRSLAARATPLNVAITRLTKGYPPRDSVSDWHHPMALKVRRAIHEVFGPRGGQQQQQQQQGSSPGAQQGDSSQEQQQQQQQQQGEGQEEQPLPPPRPLVVAQSLLTGGTDSKHYEALARGRQYRFMPARLSAVEVPRIVHGTNERYPVGAYPDAVRWYLRLTQLVAGEEEKEEEPVVGNVVGNEGDVSSSGERRGAAAAAAAA